MATAIAAPARRTFATDAAAAAPRSWGVGMTLLWSVGVAFTWMLVQIIVVGAYLLPHAFEAGGVQHEHLEAISNSLGFVLSLGTLLANAAAIGLCVLAARARRYPVREYLGLGRARGIDVALGLSGVAVIFPVADGLLWLLDQPLVSAFMQQAYQTAGWVPLFIAVRVAAMPLGEEIFFRGFLYRGLAESWPGPRGAILLTSLIGAVIHLQYGPSGVSVFFVASLLLGWLRWKTGSVTLTVLLHAVVNLVATLQAAMDVELPG